MKKPGKKTAAVEPETMIFTSTGSLLETVSVGELEFELLRRALNRTIESIKHNEIALAHLRARQERQMRELAIQVCRLEKEMWEVER